MAKCRLLYIEIQLQGFRLNRCDFVIMVVFFFSFHPYGFRKNVQKVFPAMFLFCFQLNFAFKLIMFPVTWDRRAVSKAYEISRWQLCSVVFLWINFFFRTYFGTNIKCSNTGKRLLRAETQWRFIDGL